MIHTLKQTAEQDAINAKTVKSVLRIGGTPAVAYTYKNGVYFTFDFIEQKWNCDEEMVKKINKFLNS